MSDSRLDGWTLWVNSLIAAALSAERKNFAEVIGQVIAGERARVRAERTEDAISIAALQVEIAAIKKALGAAAPAEATPAIAAVDDATRH